MSAMKGSVAEPSGCHKCFSFLPKYIVRQYVLAFLADK